MKKSLLTKFLLASLCLIAGTISLSHISVLAEEGPFDDVDGELTSQNFNNRASVTNFGLEDSAGEVVNPGSALTPSQSYTVSIEVSDPDTIADLNSFEIRFFYFNGTPATPGALSTEFNGAHNTDATGDALVMEWNVTTQAMNIVSSGAVFTWEILNSTVPAINESETSFKFEVEFRISKVAQFSTPNDLKWYFGTIINDGKVSLNSGSDPEDVVDFGLVVVTGSSVTEAPSGWNMNWYGEVVVSEEAKISWDDVPSGVTFGGENSNQNLSGINFISNGDYVTNIKSTSTWEAVITEDLANTIFSGFTPTDIEALIDGYNTLFTNANLIGTTEAAFVGVTFDNVNQAANSISDTAVTWAGFQVLLPQSSPSANLTGASLVTGPSVLNTAGLTEQFFAIGFDYNTAGDAGPFYVGTDFVGFKPTNDYSQVRTTELGHDYDLLLKLALSNVFQRARYEGKLTVQIINATPGD